MTKGDKIRILKVAEFHLKEWQRLNKESNGNEWYKLDARQCQYDALRAMKYYGFIKEFNLNGIVEID